jgi:hypothetical protein
MFNLIFSILVSNVNTLLPVTPCAYELKAGIAYYLPWMQLKIPDYSYTVVRQILLIN